MIRIFLIAVSLVFIMAPLSGAMMHEEKTMNEMMNELKDGDAPEGHMAAPGYGGHMMNQGQGGHMGSGGHMGGMSGYDCGMGYGGGHMMGGMMGQGMMFDSEEEYMKHLDDTADLRRQMHNKQFDLTEALRDPKTDKDTILKIKKEMMELKVKMLDTMIKK